MYVHVKLEGSYRAVSAIDEALWNLKDKDAGKPVYELLGGPIGDLEAYATFPISKPAEQLVEDGQWLAEKVFPRMKIILGHGIEDDREKITRVVRGIPDGLAIDVNTTYDVKDAMKVGETASEYGLEWFEEPVSHTNIQGQAHLNERLSVSDSAYQNHLAHYPAVDHLEADALEIYRPPSITVAGSLPPTASGRSSNRTTRPSSSTRSSRRSTTRRASTSRPPVRSPRSSSSASTPTRSTTPGEYIASPYVENQSEIYVRDGGAIEPPEKPKHGLKLDDEVVEECRLS